MKKIMLTLGAVIALGGGFVGWHSIAYYQEVETIKDRYQLIREAFADDDPDAINAFIAPGHLGRKGTILGWIKSYAGPLNDDWDVNLNGDKATIIPHRIYHFHVIPGGSGFEMLKVSGEWYLTGKIMID